jgi:hypothetical protein
VSALEHYIDKYHIDLNVSSNLMAVDGSAEMRDFWLIPYRIPPFQDLPMASRILIAVSQLAQLFGIQAEGYTQL